MAILSEMISEDCIRHYSDLGVKLRQIETGEIFPDAVDVIPCQFTYEETDKPLDDEEIEDDEAFKIIMGEADN